MKGKTLVVLALLVVGVLAVANLYQMGVINSLEGDVHRLQRVVASSYQIQQATIAAEVEAQLASVKQGPQGPQGLRGPEGPRGPTGPSPSLELEKKVNQMESDISRLGQTVGTDFLGGDLTTKVSDLEKEVGSLENKVGSSGLLGWGGYGLIADVQALKKCLKGVKEVVEYYHSIFGTRIFSYSLYEACPDSLFR